jgi:hypothetical protein
LACANEFLGAKKIGYQMMYVERWFLNPDYSQKDVPSGTAFYGAAANKIRNKFNIVYYVNDEKNSENSHSIKGYVDYTSQWKAI